MKSPVPVLVSVEADPSPGALGALDDFALEGAGGRTRPAGPKAVARVDVKADVRDRRHWLVIGLAIVTIVEAPFVVRWALPLVSAAPMGNLIIDTEPSGVEVRVDGKVAGVAPLRMPISPGQRTIELRHAGVVRAVPLLVAEGETLRQRFEFIPTAPAGQGEAARGTLQVTTDPARATVVIDGTVRGVAPLTIGDLATGEHTLAVRFAGRTVQRTVRVHPGSTASVQITMPSPAGALSGWLDVDVPASLRIWEEGRLLGTTDVDRLMLPVGDHELEIGSDELGFRTQRAVRVNPGATTSVRFDLPRASLSINAQPWAEVWINGERAGETPLGNLVRPIGRYDVILRHPQLGERRESVLVTLKQPARVSVDLRQRQ